MVIDKTITVTMSEFMSKATDHENKYLQYYIVYLIDDLELLQSSYLTEYNLKLIAPIVRSSKQARTIDK